MSTFINEAGFEKHIRNLLKNEVVAYEPGIRLLDSKGIADIVICREYAPSVPPAIFFIEVKYASRTPSGELNSISVSEGIQSEILRERPEYLESHLLWLLGSQSRAGYYWRTTSSELLPYITTKPLSVRKMNNISLNIFHGGGREYRLNEMELSDFLADWLRETV